MVNSINTNIAAYYAQANIGLAANAAAGSVSRLSSGNRIVRASDDVAALSTGTSLRTNVTTLRIALINASQGTSLLQVADGALSQVTEILQRQKAIALQAGSGSLTNSDRVFLNQEFQSLVSEIDRITGTTNFNGVKLINGSLSQSAAIKNVDDHATGSSINVSFSNTIAAAETVIVNGVTLTATNGTPTGLQFNIGANIAETVNNLAARLNAIAEDNSLVDGTNITAAQKLSIGEAKYSAVGNSLVISSRSGGSLSQTFRVSALGTATTAGEADLNGSFGGTSFNLFAVTTGWSSANTIVTNDAAAAGTPFQNGNSITATVNGVAKTLMTLTDGAGTGAGGEYTLKDIVDGINANADTTGFKAALVYSSGTYNIRLNYEGLASNVLMNLGTNYNSTTYTMTGANLDLSDSGSSNVIGTSAADLNRSIMFTRFTTIVDSGDVVDAASISANVTAASPNADSAPFRIGDDLTVTINGQEVFLHEFAAGDGLDDIITGINSRTAQTGVYAAITGTANNYNINMYYTDISGGAIAIDAGTGLYTGTNIAANTAVAGTTTGANLTQTTIYGLKGGANDGLGVGNTSVSGTVGNNILADLSQAHAQVALVFTQNAAATETITVAGTTFTFTSNTTAAPNEILLGDTLGESLNNAISAINSYLSNGHALGTAAYELSQLDITRDGNNLLFTGKKLANVVDITGSTSTVNTTVTGASRTNSGNLNNAATTYGVNTDGVTNSAFTGTISGFDAAYKSTDVVDLSIVIGDYTYTAQNVDMTVASNTAIRFLSNTLTDGSNGGYFDIQLQGGKVTTFANQTGADAVANRLDAAFSSLTFTQKRNISSYEGTQSISAAGSVIGSLLGTKMTGQLSSFENVNLSDVQVTAPTGSNSDATITLTINGVKFSTASGIGSTLGSNQTYRLVSAEDPNQFVDFTTGSDAIDISSSENADAVETALTNAFGSGSGSAALTFQIGTTSDDQLAVSIGSATTDSLFSGVKLDVLSQAHASAASSVLDEALATVTSLRASVGALQSRFNFASANIQISVQNQDAARGELLDTDIASEATNYATAQVKLQAGISVLAQANQQLQSLLKLIG